MVPADEGLGADRCQVACLDDGLVEHCELAIVECMTQVGGDREALQRFVLHTRTGHLETTLSVSLGHVHRHIGVPQQVAGCIVGRLAQGDAYAGTHRHFGIAETERGLESLRDSTGQVLGRSGHVAGFDENGKLITTEAGDGVTGPGDLDDSLRDSDEELVTGGVAEAVVHGLEVVDVQEQHCQRRCVSLGPAQRLAHPIEEQRPVREPGQRVMKCLVSQSLLKSLALLDRSREESHRAGDGLPQRPGELLGQHGIVEFAGSECPRLALEQNEVGHEVIERFPDELRLARTAGRRGFDGEVTGAHRSGPLRQLCERTGDGPRENERHTCDQETKQDTPE